MRGALVTAVLLLAGIAAWAGVPAQDPGPAVALYRQLRDPGLDSAQVYQVRDASLDRGEIHITLSSGTIAFSRSVAGRVTGAVFDGDGEILLVPPNPVERTSMALFVGTPILEERFTTAFFRFSDNTFEHLQASLRPAEDSEAFLARWGPTFHELGAADAFELLPFLTWQGEPSDAAPGIFWHARLAGLHLGAFDVFLDSANSEQVLAGQSNYANGALIFDVWTSFASRAAGAVQPGKDDVVGEQSGGNFRITATKVRTHVLPSRDLEAQADLTLEATRSGARTLVFELSRYLKVSSVESDGVPAEFIQNESLEGGDLARRGNDLVAVVLPQPLRAGEKLELRFHYAGGVLSEAGGGLMYVGARGTWYPTLGAAMTNFDLEFRHPAGWTLVATGKRVSSETVAGEQVSRWISERPIPLAGFNLGKYQAVRAKAGGTELDVFAARGVEHSFPEGAPKSAAIPPIPPFRYNLPNVMPPPPPVPSAEAQAVAQRSARTLAFFAQHLGPFPFSSLEVTQMPGPVSQGWPGLIFLSSYAFLNAAERERLHLSRYEKLLYGELMEAHEAAHQWWGDAVLWKDYRDVWLSEALANYCALLAMEQEKPEAFRAVLEQYRQDLVRKWHDGPAMQEAGPVTLGHRLTSSRLPEAYEVVVYGRGTWLLHMLREMFRDADRESPDPDARFYQVLRSVRERFDGRALSTSDFQEALEEALPSSLRYEGKNSLAWFFDEWVNGTALPRLQLSGVRFTHRNGKSVVSGSLLQNDAPDSLVSSVPLYARTEGGKTVYLGRVFADSRETEFHLPAPAGARAVVIDPHQTVLTRP